MNYEENLMVEIAWLYYKEGLTQQEIGDSLGISRMKVLKFLDKARLMNIVSFDIALEAQNHQIVKHSIAKKFNLDEVYIVPSSSGDVNRTVGMAAAQFIKSKTENLNSFILNIGYGETISHILPYLHFQNEMDLSIVSLTGGVSNYIGPGSQYNSIKMFNCKPSFHIIPAPLSASSKEVAESFLSESSVKQVLQLSKFADMTLVGIGGVSQRATMVREHIITADDLMILKKCGAVGDMLTQYYDKNGNIVDFHIHSKLISNKLNSLKEMKNVIGISGGPDKVDAIMGALKGGYLNVLVTDVNTAESIYAIIKEDD